LKALADPGQDDNVTKAIEFLKQHSDVNIKNIDCANCHQIQADSDAAQPRLQGLSRYIEFAQAFEEPAKSSDAEMVAKENVREKQELERQQRLAPLRKEIDEINAEIQKLREELELQNQRDNSRIELQRLRMQLEESRKARQAPQPVQRRGVDFRPVGPRGMTGWCTITRAFGCLRLAAASRVGDLAVESAAFSRVFVAAAGVAPRLG
jgi:TolA-binding protein